ncbi:RNF180 [Lepeophtheirus salmonis]|uniref:RNF180 n=1 Tax=Lepeophtheirus salmonis TaxID=72036 RepID=A0A7R8CB44_LEPSM|nr:RNF180 [Lepeophtheirus salmonis]CAF2752958.1 RNF180 [Lepeophtheirus salmonis]
MLESINCKKCRFSIVDKSCLPSILCEKGQDETHWHLISDFDYSSNPSTTWIYDAIQKSEWTKGKLKCECGSRLGSFNFIGGDNEPIKITKVKVDIKNSSLTKNLLEIRESSDESCEYDWTSSSEEPTSTIRLQEEKKTKHKYSSLTLNENDDNDSEIEELKQKLLLQRTIENTSSLDNVGEDLICPICLDLFYLPHKVGRIQCFPYVRCVVYRFVTVSFKRNCLKRSRMNMMTYIPNVGIWNQHPKSRCCRYGCFPLIRYIISESQSDEDSEEPEQFTLSFIPSTSIDEYIFNAITHLLTFFGFALMVLYHSMTGNDTRHSSFHQMLRNQLDNIIENYFRRISPIMVGIFGYRLAYGLYMAFWKS